MYCIVFCLWTRRNYFAIKGSLKELSKMSNIQVDLQLVSPHSNPRISSHSCLISLGLKDDKTKAWAFLKTKTMNAFISNINYPNVLSFLHLIEHSFWNYYIKKSKRLLCKEKCVKFSNISTNWQTFCFNERDFGV